MMRTTINIDDDLVAAAKELNLNMSAIAREAITKRVNELRAAHDQDIHLIKAQQDGVPVSFWGRTVAQHAILETNAYLTEKGAVVLTSFIDNGNDETIDSITDSVDAFIDQIAEGHRNYPEALSFPKEDQEFLQAIAEAAGVPFRRHLDI